MINVVHVLYVVHVMHVVRVGRLETPAARFAIQMLSGNQTNGGSMTHEIEPHLLHHHYSFSNVGMARTRSNHIGTTESNAKR